MLDPRKLILLSAVFTMVAGCAGGDGFEGDPSDPALKSFGAKAEPSIKTAALSASDTLVANHLYWEKRTYIESMYMIQGYTIDWSTTVESGNRDPAMVLIRYDPGFADPNRGCSVAPSSQAKFTVIAQNDNGNGNLQPRLQHTFASSGCYTLVIYPQDPSDAAPMTTAVFRKETWGLSKLVCNPFCHYTREHWLTSSSVPITGTIIRPPAFDTMTTMNPRNGADPWVFIFNYSTHNGASNDDTIAADGSGSLNSTIDIPGFSYDGNTYSSVLLTGYYTPDIPQDASWADSPIVEWWAYKRAP